MIKRQKKLIILLSILFIIAFVFPAIIIIITKNEDVFPISLAIFCVIILLILNVRASKIDRLKFIAKANKKEVEKDIIKTHKEGQKLLWITFGIMVLITIIVSITIYAT